ncbi:MAG TPA: hypothetical protein VK469_06275 [Candidatus Kapabacteria bacterium]|nr:hypothetical protein [Candidatus Kapabacteria bacterium]
MMNDEKNTAPRYSIKTNFGIVKKSESQIILITLMKAIKYFLILICGICAICVICGSDIHR